MNLRIIITLMGFATGWFLFEEMIVGAVMFTILGITIWLKHRRKQKGLGVKLKNFIK